MDAYKINNFTFYEEVTQNLKNIIKKNILSNGYIFYGPEGVGKKQIAVKFIENILKQYSPSSNIEERILKNNHPDYLLIEPTYIVKGKILKKSDPEFQKNNSAEIIRIEQIRNIKDFLGKKSIESGKKIILIVNAHLLNESASNCLLKILEEPANGIFILITSKKNLLLDTIISRCQLIRFKSYSNKDLENFLKKNLDPSNSEICKNYNLQDLINSAGGSPKRVLENIKIWSELSNEIIDKLHTPIKENLEILRIAKIISERLEIYEQVFLINFIQIKWWRQTRNSKIIEKLETLKSHINNFIQPRLAWEVALLQIAKENF